MKGQMSNIMVIVLAVILLVSMLGIVKILSTDTNKNIDEGYFKWGEGKGIGDVKVSEKPKGESDFKDVLTTHYFISHRKFFSSYSAFEKTVRIEGAGIFEKDGKEYILDYKGNQYERTEENKNGPLAYRKCGGQTPIEHRTIAVDPKLIEPCSNVYVYFGDCEECKKWNGCYVAEDVGSAIKGEHIDLFVGIGKDGKENDPAYELPRKSELWVGKC